MPKPKGKPLGKLVLLKVTAQHKADIKACTGGGPGGSQGLYRKLDAVNDSRSDGLLQVYELEELAALKRAARRKGDGTWQRTARDVLAANGIAW